MTILLVRNVLGDEQRLELNRSPLHTSPVSAGRIMAHQRVQPNDSAGGRQVAAPRQARAPYDRRARDLRAEYRIDRPNGVTRMPENEESAAAFAEAVEAVVRTARVFAAITAESIAQAGEGVTLPQLRVLVLASTSGVLSNAGVARALDVHISNASRICDRLVQAGLLDRRDSPADRRQVELTLTPAGSRLVEAVTDHRQMAFTRILVEMTPRERAALARSLGSFAGAGEAQLERRDLSGP